jgi:hypothetical protein
VWIGIDGGREGVGVIIGGGVVGGVGVVMGADTVKSGGTLSDKSEMLMEGEWLGLREFVGDKGSGDIENVGDGKGELHGVGAMDMFSSSMMGEGMGWL